MRRLETIRLGLFLGAWVVVLLHWLHIVSLSGNLPLQSLYPLYSFASALGWSAGTVYVHRRRGLGERERSLVMLLYFLGPQGLIFLLWVMTTVAFQRKAPWAAVYALGVYSIFFLVPVKLLRLAR